LVRGPGLGLAVTWSIRVIAAGLKLSATRVGLPLNKRYALRASFADEAGAVIGPATGVSFASDNTQVAAVAEDGTVTAAGYGDAAGTDWARLTSSPAADGGPALTADGQSVVFHSKRTGHRQVFVQPITSSDAIQLTQEPADNWQPTVSPDGETIAFVSNRDGND